MKTDNKSLGCEMFEPNLPRALKLVMDLMSIPGKSGEEKTVSDYITKTLIAAGAPKRSIQSDKAHLSTSLSGNTGNLVFKLPGTFKAPRRFFSAHMDTVPLCVGCKPVRRGNTIRPASPKTALGADNRSGCAVILSTALEILKTRLPHPPMTFCWTVQEEVGVQGSKWASTQLWSNPQLGFNWDGGSPSKLTTGCVGSSGITIEIKGIASHAALAPEKGVSAITIASLAISDLHKNGWHGAIRKGNKRGTSNVGVISGGNATNLVTDCVVVRAEARSHDSKFRKHILTKIKQSFESAAKKICNDEKKHGKVKFDATLKYDSFVLKANEPCILMAENAIRSIGKTPHHEVSDGGVDPSWFFHHGIPTVSLGCGQRNLHMVSEALNIPDYESGLRIALRIATAKHTP